MEILVSDVSEGVEPSVRILHWCPGALASKQRTCLGSPRAWVRSMYTRPRSSRIWAGFVRDVCVWRVADGGGAGARNNYRSIWGQTNGPPTTGAPACTGETRAVYVDDVL